MRGPLGSCLFSSSNSSSITTAVLSSLRANMPPYYGAVRISLCSRTVSSLLRKKARPSFQISGLRLIKRHRFIHTYLPPQQQFYLIFPARSECACVRLEPDVLRSVRPSHPMGEPGVEFARACLRIRWISISRQDCMFLRISHGARPVSIRYAGLQGVHLARRQGGIRNRAEAAGLVDVDLPAVLSGCHAEQ
jgi:hypothetical protein